LLDTAQVSGFTFAGHQASVKDDPGIVVLGSTHKTLPLMPTGYILSNDSSVFKKVQEAIFPTLIRSYNTLSQLGVACGLHDWQRRAFGYLKRIEALQRIMNRELQKAGVKSQQIRSGQNHQMWILAADKADSAVERLRQANILLDARDFPGVGRGLRLGLQTLALDDVETTTVALLAQCIGRALRDAPVEFDQRTYRCGPCRD
jgi:glycine/serine hydroxymethyltransferase